MPLIFSNSDPPFNIYLAFSLMTIFISSEELQQAPTMEQLANYTSIELDEAEQIDKLLDETAPLIITNTICCSIVIIYKIIIYLVLGTLRVSEQQHLRDTFWDYLIQKGLFVLFILDVKTYGERSLWAVWSAILGSVLLLSRLCRDRFEYLSSSPTTKRWPLIKISILMGFLLIITILCNLYVFTNTLSTHSLFLLADASYVLTFVLSVIFKFIVLTYDMRTNSVWENRSPIIYYSDLLFAMSMLYIDLLHRLHLLVIGRTSIIIKGWCIMKIHTLYLEIRRRYKRHKNYTLIVQLMESSFSMASQEEIERNSDECAICWDEMTSARKLPCGHLYHNSCLRSWLEQDTSCPTCRTSLKRQEDVVDEVEDQSESETEFVEQTRVHQRNPLFHFDSSRYTNHPLLSWLPTISIEGFM